jgi:hypothetical protein
MKRSALKRCVREIVAEYESKPYDYWDTVTFPLTFERVFEGREIQVEIDILESTPEYLNIDFSVFAGGLSAYFPVGTNIIINKTKKTDKTGAWKEQTSKKNK